MQIDLLLQIVVLIFIRLVFQFRGLTIGPRLGIEYVFVQLTVNHGLQLIDYQLLFSFLSYLPQLVDILLLNVLEHTLVEHFFGHECERLEGLLVLQE